MQLWKILPLVILLVGCVISPTTQPSAQGSAPSMTKTAGIPATLPPTQTPAVPGIQAATASSTPLSNLPLILTIYSPKDQAIVSQPSVEIHGEVSTDAVLTINDDIYVLPKGIFTKTVALVEGPNAIQIIASDMNGNEVDQILTITYQP